MHNKYIVIEGLEGSGKTTACHVISDVFKNFGINNDLIITREPGGTKIGEKLRNLILDISLDLDEVINTKTEVLLFYAARVQLVETVIKPELAKGNWVISDRHDLSTQAYQGGGNGVNRKILTMLHSKLLGDFHPGLTLYLDVTPEIGMKRARTRGKYDRIEQKSLDFFNRVRCCYHELAAQDNSICTINANQPLSLVNHEIRNIITCWIKEQQA